MNKYELFVRGHTVIIDENRLISVLMFNNSFTYSQLNTLKTTGQITVRNIEYKLKKI